MTKHMLRVGSWLLGVFVGIAPLSAMADTNDKPECGESYEQAQYLRREHKLVSAREKLLACIQSSCPSYMSADCSQWLREVEGMLPTVVFAVRDAAGKDVSSVRVFSDGEILAKRLNGETFTMDPGEHVFTFEFDDGKRLTQKIVLRAGEKNRAVEVNAPGADQQQVVAVERPSLAPTLIAGGIGVASLAVSGVFAILAKGKFDELNDKACAPNCDKSDVDSLRSNTLITDISLGVGVAGIVVGGIFLASYLSKSPSEEKKPDTALRIAPTAGRNSGGLAVFANW